MRAVSVMAAVNLGSGLKAGYRGLPLALLQNLLHRGADATLHLLKPWAGAGGRGRQEFFGRWEGRAVQQMKLGEGMCGLVENANGGCSRLVQLTHSSHVGR